MEEIKVSKFHVTIKGDESVGIFDQRFEIGPDFYFENEEELRRFKWDIRKAFELAFGEPTHVETQEEIDKQNEIFEKIAMEAEEASNNFVDESITEEELEREIEKDKSNE